MVTYPTWDPATAANVTLSGGNLVVTNLNALNEAGAHVADTSGKTSGKYYFEVTSTVAAAGGNMSTGIGTPTSTFTSMGNGGAVIGAVVYTGSGGGSIYANGSFITTLGTFANGNVAGMAVDLDNRKIWFRKAPSGNWNNSGTADPATNVGGIAIPAGTMVPFAIFGAAAAGNIWTANFGASAFSGAVPSSFISGWPDPAAPPTDPPSGNYVGGGGRGRMIRKRKKGELDDLNVDELVRPYGVSIRIGRQSYD